MFSPPNTPNVSDWFQRLETAWRRMPAAEQGRQREEVEQHLETLAAAKVAQEQSDEEAWNAALKQFGDPTQIGKKMYQEWCQSRMGFRADMTAISFGFGLLALRYYIVMLLWPLWFDNLHSIAIATSWSILVITGVIIG